jgi:hypothetical protein
MILNMPKLSLMIILIFFSSCSQFEVEKRIFNGEVLNKDYVDQLTSFGPDYLKSSEITEIVLSNESRKYIKSIFRRFKENNENFLNKEGEPSFHLIKDQKAFLFSLPNEQYFFSTGLFQKYFKSEQLFLAALSAEIVKSNKVVYEKKVIVPLKFYSTEKMLQITRVTLETKNKINEWSYIVLKRAGVDPFSYLNWIQVQNRNNLDFSFYLGEIGNINREEQMIKNFIVKENIGKLERKANESNSSKEYYQFLKNTESKS